MRRQFKDTVLALSDSDPRTVMILGDVSVYLFREFQARYPERFYNMGICENTLVSIAAGLSSQGFVPFVHTIAPFVTERSFEQIKIDMCYNRFSANIVSCGASFDYAWDGATHHCFNDLAMLRLLPNMEVVQPGSCRELDILMRSRYAGDRTTYFRLSDHPHQIELPVKFGNGVTVRSCGAPLTVVTAGPLLAEVVEACRDLNVNLLYFHTLKPIDRELISAYRHTDFLVVHDAFGLYEAVCEVANISVSYHGLKDDFCSSYGTLDDIRRSLGLDARGIRAAVKRTCSEGGRPPGLPWEISARAVQNE